MEFKETMKWLGVLWLMALLTLAIGLMYGCVQFGKFNTGAGGNLTENLSASISSIYFNASTFVQKNVSATNQSASVPLFNVTNTGGTNRTILCNQSPSISGVSVKCAKTYNTSAALPCNTSAPSIGNLSANTSTGVWCWADFYFPQNKTANLTINITGG